MSIALSANPAFPVGAASPQTPAAAARGPESSRDSDSSASSDSSSSRRDAAPRGEQAQARNGQRLDEAELAELKDLKARDREVRAHEAAHQSVGGQHAGAASFTYSRGPDGVNYAIGGEVPIDTAPVPNNPQATIDKMRTVRAAALAPAEPSSQDRQVAAEAMQTLMQARAELSANSSDSEQDAASSDSASESEGNARQQREADTAYRSVARLDDAREAADGESPQSPAFLASA
ncbi:putative metalloprotease CJM1_0395 family protein [Marinobacter sp. JSM 1782161]|uniref:putative metalloprotease CJM1_0395 family protein n=1 Tax=Marinobacter sp. JSM 1782161 TaxID=2685906 RepID=UPI002B1BD407|nr:putative metalloprotease CJM1_0395 family protein [Marinobacter sp. JSM 1782161]